MVQLKGRTVATLAVTLALFFLLGILFKLHYFRDRTSIVGVLPQESQANNTSNESESLSASISEAGSATNSSEINDDSLEQSGFNIDEECLQCICMEATRCRPSRCSNFNMCGIFRISEQYWIDAGRPKALVTALDSTQKDDHGLCVTDDDCASRTVKAYMERYARDCDNSGKIDCDDFMVLHMLGPSGCLDYSENYLYRFMSCGSHSSPEFEQNYSYEW